MKLIFLSDSLVPALISKMMEIILFDLEDGIKRYEVYNYDNDEVLALCEKLCECEFESLKEILVGNHYYKSVLG